MSIKAAHMRDKNLIRGFWMNNLDVGVHMWTSDKNMVCLPAACYLFNKFWPYKQQVKILGYAVPQMKLPDNFEFISLGTQRGPSYWSDDMIDYYSSCNNQYIYQIWEDCLIAKPVNNKILKLVEEVAAIDKNFFKFNLTADVSTRPHTVLKSGKSADLILAGQNTRYRLSTQHCVWDRELFLQKLEKGQTPWQFELNDQASLNDGLNIYSTKREYAIYMCHLYKNGTKRSDWYNCVYGNNGNKTHNVVGLDEQTKDLLERNKWVPEL